jgi:hypothetical protein
LAAILEADSLFYYDLPLAIVGVDLAREINGALPGRRRDYDSYATDASFAPFRAVTFTNFAIASHLDMATHLTRRLSTYDMALSDAVYVNHGVEILDDRVRDGRTNADLREWWRVVRDLGLRRASRIVLRTGYRALRSTRFGPIVRTLRGAFGRATPTRVALNTWIAGGVAGFNDLASCAQYVDREFCGRKRAEPHISPFDAERLTSPAQHDVQ